MHPPRVAPGGVVYQSGLRPATAGRAGRTRTDRSAGRGFPVLQSPRERSSSPRPGRSPRRLGGPGRPTAILAARGGARRRPQRRLSPPCNFCGDRESPIDRGPGILGQEVRRGRTAAHTGPRRPRSPGAGSFANRSFRSSSVMSWLIVSRVPHPRIIQRPRPRTSVAPAGSPRDGIVQEAQDRPSLLRGDRVTIVGPRATGHPAGENVLGDLQAERDAADVPREVRFAVLAEPERVEGPVHAEEDATQAVLDDHLPEAVGELAAVPRPHGARLSCVADEAPRPSRPSVRRRRNRGRRRGRRASGCPAARRRRAARRGRRRRRTWRDPTGTRGSWA
jgi:hypothetical protein